jgi:hypothetical protein
MAARQGIAVGPTAQTGRNQWVPPLSSVTYTSPIPGSTGGGADLNNMLSTWFQAGQIIYYVHIEALRRGINYWLNHYHQYADYYQVPTYGGAYGNQGWTDSNGGAGDRNSYWRLSNSAGPKIATLSSGKYGAFWAYSDLTRTNVSASSLGVGLKILASDYQPMSTAVTEIKSHSHVINDQTSA